MVYIGSYVVDLRTGVSDTDGVAWTREGYVKLEPCLNLGNLGKNLFFWILKVRWSWPV